MPVSSWKTYSLFLSLGFAWAGTAALGQEVFDPRAIAIGASGVSVVDSRGFVSNPAGMVGMRDWDVNTATYLSTSVPGSGFVFFGFGIGKKFFGSEYAAVQYSPGALLQFTAPSNDTVRGIGVNISSDKVITYNEPVAVGYAHRFSPSLSVGLSARLRSESISDVQYQRLSDTSTVIIPLQRRSLVDSYFLDAGVLWKPSPAISLSLSGRGLIDLRSGTLPEELERYALHHQRTAALGIGWRPLRELQAVSEFTTDKSGTFGTEWTPVAPLAVRGGLYFSSDEKPFVYAAAAGAGWTYDFVEIDLSYLHFLNQANRKGTSFSSNFDAGAIRNITMSPFASDKVSVSLKAMVGDIRDRTLRIESVDITGSVFPSAFESFAYRPLGEVRVRNVSAKPVQARASLYVEHLMDGPTESAQVPIGPGQTVSIPLTALFNDKVKSILTTEIRDGSVTVTTTADNTADDGVQVRLLVRGRNDWNGDIHSLRYFVRPDDPEIIRTSRDILLAHKDSLMAVGQLGQFAKARTLLNAFSGSLLYISDPKQGTDFVQYPAETLRLKSGDCDDISVLFASLLSSIGVSTAFVEVVPPGHPEQGHIYLMFDTGISPQFASAIADNPKRYVIRKSHNGGDTIWLPVEATIVSQGFQAAWERGAQEYFDATEIGLGLVKGWVRIVDVY